MDERIGFKTPQQPKFFKVLIPTKQKLWMIIYKKIIKNLCFLQRFFCIEKLNEQIANVVGEELAFGKSEELIVNSTNATHLT